MHISFTKWPRLIVVGDKVTEEQAEEIILRTTSYLSTNSRGFERMAAEILGIPISKYGILDMLPFRDRVGGLSLEYLGNHRIASSWIGGPHGWCDWDGHIGCSVFNIGKWPSFAEVNEEWAMIANAFPFLRLRAQLITDEGEGIVCADWDVVDGKAVARMPENGTWSTHPRIAEPSEDVEAEERVMRSVVIDGQGHGEEGVSLERLSAAYKRLMAKRTNLLSRAGDST